MESLLIEFYVTAELWSPVFGRPSWAYHLKAQAKRLFFFFPCPFRIQLFLCIMGRGRRRRVFSLCYSLLIADLSVALFNCLCASNYSEPETIPSTATCIWITGVLSGFEKSQEAKKGDSHTGLSLKKSSVDTINHYPNLGRKENIWKRSHAIGNQDSTVMQMRNLRIRKEYA